MAGWCTQHHNSKVIPKTVALFCFWVTDDYYKCYSYTNMDTLFNKEYKIIASLL